MVRPVRAVGSAAAQLRRVVAIALPAFAAACLLSPPAAGHPATPPPPPAYPPQEAEEIPEEDEERYRSRVTAIKPPVRGLRARIVGNQEKLEVTWTGEPALVVMGTQGEPMVRMSARGIDINERSPSAYLSAERYARVTLPVAADPRAPPRWRRIESPGSMSWYDHRAQWMRTERPEIVGEGDRPVTIFHWRVPARLGERRIVIEGALDWVPDPSAIRAERSRASSPLLSAAILSVALAAGWLGGMHLRRRVGAS